MKQKHEAWKKEQEIWEAGRLEYESIYGTVKDGERFPGYGCEGDGKGFGRQSRERKGRGKEGERKERE